MIVTIHLSYAMHAPLFARYSSKTRGFEEVGTHMGKYSRENDEGVEYRLLGEGQSAKGVAHSADYSPGHFYPETVFVWGYEESVDEMPLTHEEVERFCKTMWPYYEPHRVILPNGTLPGGVWTWDNAMKFYPDRCPSWYGISGELKNKFPSAEFVAENPNFKILLFDGEVPFLKPNEAEAPST